MHVASNRDRRPSSSYPLLACGSLNSGIHGDTSSSIFRPSVTVALAPDLRGYGDTDAPESASQYTEPDRVRAFGQLERCHSWLDTRKTINPTWRFLKSIYRWRINYACRFQKPGYLMATNGLEVKIQVPVKFIIGDQDIKLPPSRAEGIHTQRRVQEKMCPVFGRSVCDGRK
ncbi:hypothetical protein NC653_013283 [Populus alba x Populus x berolinensis]|uniref:Uncharacterized protein n=1 Tax=Populus alba x Populus x berolinensis TaxID=444605 RepID=A0AAD6QU83_9ROSI|nr:hypothetical protein NC653_013283 [Populus alba x Populus x berolinensis]